MTPQHNDSPLRRVLASVRRAYIELDRGSRALFELPESRD
jgi:hypothetical protein